MLGKEGNAMNHLA